MRRRSVLGLLVALIGALYAFVSGYLFVVDRAAGHDPEDPNAPRTLRLGALIFLSAAVLAVLTAYYFLR